MHQPEPAFEIDVAVYRSPALARYGFGAGHPFGPDRLDAFWGAMVDRGLDTRVTVCAPREATREEIERFHTPEYVDRVELLSMHGAGFLDEGDTPAYPGVFEAASTVVGASLEAMKRVMAGQSRRAFVPIGGLHHAMRHKAGGFCVFNDCGVVIETLRAQYGIERVAYVDIDAHHGDGLYYPFEDDPHVVIADIHQDGRTLYPGTGAAGETGRGAAKGTKLNLPLLPFADDQAFFAAWEQAEAFLDAQRPQVVLLQCGADSIAGDPITNLQWSPAAHAHAARRLCALAERHAGGRIIGFGGGGYNRRNLGRAWSEVVSVFLDAPPDGGA